VVAGLEKKAGHLASDAAKTVEVISGRLRYTEAEQAEILDHFIKGGDLTAGGIMHAVTSAARCRPTATPPGTWRTGRWTRSAGTAAT
jgi:hypothetical protein